ncbi:hypothetical protein JCM11251_007749 [Rhodosporidiobolus azoricus]
MPPRRARASSVSSTTSASNPRRSTRVSKPPPSPAAPRNPTNGRRKRAGSVASDIWEESDDLTDSDEEGEESTTSHGSKKRKSSSSKANGASPRKKRGEGKRVIAPKPRKAPKAGLNPIPQLFDLFPLHSSFSLPPSAGLTEVPSAEVAPRAVFIFGTGDMGQLGLGTEMLDEIKRPRRHVGFQGKIDREEEGWKKGVADLMCGGMHSLVIDSDGRVWSWGINDNASLGRITAKPDIEAEELESNAMLVEELDQPLKPFKAIRVGAGDSHSLAISDYGDLKAWGSFRSSEGLLGFDGSDKSAKTQLKPSELANLNAHTIVQVANGDDHFLALTSTGHVFACGNGEQSQLGRKIIQRHKTHGLTPERLALKNLVLVGAGSYHSFAVDKDGEVYAWGLNSFHQTGVSDEDGGWEDTINTPTIVASLSPKNHDGARVVQIVAGAHHSLFLFSNGQVWACGRCDGHEVGLPDDHPEVKKSDERKEEALKHRAEREKQEIAARRDENGDVNVYNKDDKLLTVEEADLQAKEAAAQGVPLPNDYVPLPVRLSFAKEPKEVTDEVKSIRTVDDFEDSGLETEDTFIVQIAAGTRHNFAVSARGYVYSWGVGESSQLGQGDQTDIDTPTRIWCAAVKTVRILRAETGGQHTILTGVDRDAEEKYAVKEKERKEKEAAKEAEEKKAKEEEEAKKAEEAATKPVENGTDAKEGEDAEMKDGEKQKEEEEKTEPVVEA